MDSGKFSILFVGRELGEGEGRWTISPSLSRRRKRTSPSLASPVWNPGEPLAVSVGNINLDGRRIWVKIRIALLGQAKALPTPASCSHNDQLNAYGQLTSWIWALKQFPHLQFPAICIQRHTVFNREGRTQQLQLVVIDSIRQFPLLLFFFGSWAHHYQ